ncbi:MAG: chromosome segregation protein SMC [Clostridia bacterium]|nr:chromosome segregation protein SMC [Clostridia bacterium]
MLLKSIEIQGFKSFADKTVLQFGNGITGVVGPNGSGKSNISDAVRWVLGEQSTKSLRGQSMEDVIFGGTADRKPHGFAEVTLTIDNTDRTLNFDNDFVAVTRRYYRSHESEYLINKAVVRLKDVHELFMDTGLGRDGYSMIGQGKIDTIVSSKSNERRDIFEEASGISRYRYRKLESERKLAQADENLLRLKDIMSELEGRVGPLKEQSRKAEIFLELAEEKKNLEIGIWLHTLDRFNDALRNQENKIAIAEAHYAEAEAELSGLAAQIDSRSKRFSDLTAQIDAYTQQIAALEESIARTEGEIAVLENSAAHNTQTTERIRGDIDALAESDVAAKQEIEARYAEIAQKKESLAQLGTKTATLTQALTELISSSESISRTMEDLTHRLNLLSAQSSDYRVEMVTAQSSVAEIDARKAAVTEEIEQAGETVQKLEAEHALLEKDLTRAEDTVSECENALQGYTLIQNTKNEKVATCRQAADTLALDIEAKLRRAQILEDLEKNMEGFSHAVKSVMQSAKKGQLRGIHGPVTQILTVPKKYTVAIEVALGNAAQHIVVDSDANAKQAIEMLKRGNLGRATFLPVQSVRPRSFEADAYAEAFGYVGVASDLVSADKQYADIVSSLLGNTIVAEDIDSAVAMAKKSGYKCKVVTLDGQVVNPGGSLTGGSLTRNAGLLSRAADIEKLHDEVKTMRADLEKRQAELAAAEQELAATDAQIISARAAISTANEDKIRLLGELRRIHELAQAAKEQKENLTAEQTALSERRVQLNETIESATAGLAQLDAQKQKLQTELDSVSGGREGNSRKREDLSAELTELRLKTIEIEKDIESVTVSAKLLEAAVVDREGKAASNQAEIEALLKENEALQSQAEQLRRQNAEATERIAAAKEQCAQWIDERDSFDKVGQELRDSEREKASEREKIGGELVRLRERKENMVREYDDVVRRLFDEYELTRSEAEQRVERIENVVEAKRSLGEVKNKIRSLGNVNVSAIEEYKEVSERYEFMTAQMEDIQRSRAELNRIISELTEQMKTLFMEGFTQIGANFSKTFTELFGGGKAELVLSEPDNILESGIDIVAKLPGKNVPSLDGLSGGEKALVAISIYFSIMRVNPPPFCFLDEVDTALDDINVERFANYMKRSDFSTQFICVTHRRGTMEAADMLYGVTMQEKGVSKLLQLNVDELIKTLHLEDK